MIDLIIDTSSNALICGLIESPLGKIVADADYSGGSGRLAVNNARSFDGDNCACIIDETIIPTTRNHMELLIPTIQSLMQSAGITPLEINAIIAGVGPGLFTGLRVGISTAIALADGWKKPIYPTVSLAALAWGALQILEQDAGLESEDITITAALDARRKEWYCGTYIFNHHGLIELSPPRAQNPTETNFSSSWLACPQALAQQLAALYPAAEPIIIDHPSSLNLWQVAQGSGLLAEIHPIYCRQPDATVGKGPKKVVPT